MTTKEVPRTLIDELTKKLVDEGKLMEAGWVGLRMLALPENAPQVQIDAMREAFFMGAEHISEAGAKERETLAWLAKHATFDDMPHDLYSVMVNAARAALAQEPATDPVAAMWAKVDAAKAGDPVSAVQDQLARRDAPAVPADGLVRRLAECDEYKRRALRAECVLTVLAEQYPTLLRQPLRGNPDAPPPINVNKPKGMA